MPKQQLQKAISELRDHLDNMHVAPEERDSLASLSAQIELMLAEGREYWDEILIDELEKRVILYEEDHPVIARVIQQIITTLNSMGL